MKTLHRLKSKKFIILAGIIILAILPTYLITSAKQDKNNFKEFSIEKLNEVSAYKIKYTGEYKFDEFLKKGVTDDLELYDFLDSIGLNPHTNITSGNDIFGCTIFTVKNQKDEVLFGRNFDWYSHPCTLVYTSPKGAYSSVSMVDLYYIGISNIPFSGDDVNNNKHLLSVPYIPLDGVNECGVAIGVMSLPIAESASDTDKKTISSLGVVRLVLDYAANVDEAVSLISKYNIYFQKMVPIHYMISDSSGKSVIVEYVEGKMNVIKNDQPWQVSTNYVLSGYDNAGRGKDRYNLAEKKLTDTHNTITKASAMDILQDVSQDGSTIWSIVYDLKKKDFDLCVNRKYNRVYSSSLF